MYREIVSGIRIFYSIRQFFVFIDVSYHHIWGAKNDDNLAFEQFGALFFFVGTAPTCVQAYKDVSSSTEWF